MGQRALDEMESVVPNLKRKILIDGAGHWIQQERPAEVNAALIDLRASIRVDALVPAIAGTQFLALHSRSRGNERMRILLAAA